MSKQKIILSIIGVLILIFGVVFSIFLVKQNQDVRAKAAPATSLAIYPVSQTITAGANGNFSVVMNTGQNQVTALDLALSFDPRVLEITTVTKREAIVSFTSELKNTVDNTNGNIFYSNYTTDKTRAVNGSDLIVLTIAAKVKNTAQSGSYQLSFLPQTAVAGIAEGQNVLTGKTSGTVTVVGASLTPTPTSTPTPTPGPTSAPNPTVTPTPTMIPTPTQDSSEQAVPTEIPTAYPIPVTGTSFPTIILTGLGIVTMILSFVVTRIF